MSSDNSHQDRVGSQNSQSRVGREEPDVNEVTRQFRALPASMTSRSAIYGSCGDRPVSQSTLSPYAEVFVPRQHVRHETVRAESMGSGECNSHYQGANNFPAANTRSSSSVSNRLRISRPNIKTPDEYESYMRNNKVKPMEKLNQVIDMLHSSTASFETIKKPVLQLAADVSRDLGFLQLAVRLILNETIHKPNFCYNGARLCVLFNTNIPGFHKMIAEQCLVYLQTYKEKNTCVVKDREMIRGVVNSLGELYYQFIDNGLKYPEVSVCSNVLYEAMKILVNLNEDKALNIKTVCQSLKLTGRHLQFSNPTSMSSLLDNLENSVQNETDENMKLRVRNIRGLYNTNWGYIEEVTDDDSNPTDNSNYERSSVTDTWEDPNYTAECSEIDDTVYYGPDGKVLTAEETSFLYCNCADTNEGANASDVEDEDTLWDPENELGPELQRAFKEFVEYSKHKNN